MRSPVRLPIQLPVRLLTQLLSLAFICIVTTQAQPPHGSGSQGDLTIDAAMRREVIEGAIKHLNNNYVFPDVAKKMEAAVRERMQRGEYNNITSAQQLARTLTDHFREISRDRHLGIRYSAEKIPARNPEAAPSAEEQARQRAWAAARNFGFEKVERLEGNIGYLEFRGFMQPELVAETVASAMTFLNNTDALIIDLRRNGGGDPATVALISSYLFDKPTHLNSIYWRPTDSTRDFWTQEKVAGKKYGNKDVWVLTSKFTFSGAEEFSYNLKNLKRATIVGETTGGGAHPVSFQRINDHFGIGVPAGRAINPITKTNWEGTGVSPDVAVPAEQALKVAQLAALKSVLAKTTDAQRKDELQSVMGNVQHELDKLKTPVATQTVQPQSAATAESEVKLPETPAGQTLGKFLKSLNSGDLEAMRRFHRDQGGSDENANQDFDFYQQSGGLKLHSVTRSEPHEIEVLVQGKKTGNWLKFTMTVGSNPPHPIDNLRVERTSAPDSKPVEKTSSAAPAKKLSEADALKEIESFLNQQAAEDKFSGAVLIARNGQPLFKKAYGLADKTTKSPNRTDTKFNLGSMNKMFTAVAIAQLVEKGKLSFNDKVGQYLPDYPNKAVAEKVTIHHLLTHTSGMGSYWNAKFDEQRTRIKTVADYVALFVNDPLQFEPGERFEYSNAGFIVLGAIIEKVSGQSYYDYVREHIYQPAGMTNSDCYEMTQSVSNMAMGYTTGDDETPSNGERRANTDSRPNRGGPAGGGYSTPEDLLRFHVALRDHKLISAKSLELLTTTKTKTGRGGYGYGFMDVEVNGKRFFGHNGGAPGIASDLKMFPDSGLTIVVMTNYDPPMMMPVTRRLAELMTGN